MKKIRILVIAGLVCSNLVNAQGTYTPVDAESKVHFVIKNFSIKTDGDFTGLKGTIRFDPAGYANAYFDITADAGTIDTDNSSRDNHLREAEYFDVEKYKTLRFTSTKVVLSSVAGRYYMFGNLTIKGVTKPVEFGFGATPKNGGYVFDGGFKINRRDFGVGGSSISMSDNVNVTLSVFAK
ncbi:MAG: YceI family protein [Chitinophagaceae bacterium]|nr:YceI family protein [Chitinophagaceae bacterium]